LQPIHDLFLRDGKIHLMLNSILLAANYYPY